MYPVNRRANGQLAAGHMSTLATSSYAQMSYPTERFCQNDTLFRPTRTSAREALTSFPHPRTRSPPKFDTIGEQPYVPRRDSMDRSNISVSKEDSLRQMEPQASPSTMASVKPSPVPVQNLEDFAFSPLTEANGMVAFSVAECALMGDEFDENSDIDRTIRRIEQRATGELIRLVCIVSLLTTILLHKILRTLLYYEALKVYDIPRVHPKYCLFQ